LLKSSPGGDALLDTAAVVAGSSLWGLAVVPFVPFPAVAAWPYMAMSAVIHFGYYVALTGAYKHGELGLTYPIMRGFAPLLVALASGSLIGESLSAAEWVGVVGITTGVALVGLAHPGEALHHGKALAFAFANAGIIAAYTLVDGLCVRTSGDALRYAMLLFVFDALAYPLLVWRQRNAEERREVIRYVRARWPMAALGGGASIASYSIALWAMGRAPVAAVAALRETSVLFAALLGTWLLKERFGAQRALGTVVIVAGVIALRLR